MNGHPKLGDVPGLDRRPSSCLKWLRQAGALWNYVWHWNWRSVCYSAALALIIVISSATYWVYFARFYR
jgi:hypothetical protein